MEIIKRSGLAEAYDRNKITSAVRKAFFSTQTEIAEEALEAITAAVEARSTAAAACSVASRFRISWKKR
jgi:transcriptional regulator NrdR family protein